MTRNDKERIKHFDDLPLEQLINEPNKVIQIATYLKVREMNGSVRKNCADIERLKKEMADKIGWKLFAALTGFMTFLIILYNVLDRVGGL